MSEINGHEPMFHQEPDSSKSAILWVVSAELWLNNLYRDNLRIGYDLAVAWNHDGVWHSVTGIVDKIGYGNGLNVVLVNCRCSMGAHFPDGNIELDDRYPFDIAILERFRWEPLEGGKTGQSGTNE